MGERVFFLLTEPCSMEVIVTAQVSLLPAATAPRKVSMVFLIAITRSAGLGSCMKLEVYHWQELPQVRFLLRQKFCCDKHMFVMTNTCLLRQIHVCHDKKIVATKMIIVAVPANNRTSPPHTH